MTNHIKEKNNSTIKIQYFIDYWNDLTYGEDSIENDLVHSIVYNPKELIKEYINEIERKNLSNKDNKKFFIDSLNSFANLELDSLSFIKSLLTLILKEQNSKKNDFSYLLHLLKLFQKELENFNLGKSVIDELVQILTDETIINFLKIKHLVNLLTFELSHKKYSSKSIRTIIDNIFSKYKISEDGYLYTSYPHNIYFNKEFDFKSNEYKNFKEKVIDYIDNLTIKDRIKALKKYLDKDYEELRFIFQLKGLKGNSINISIGDVQIYNPLSVSLMKKTSKHIDECFKKYNNDEKIQYCNAAVAVKVIDVDYAKQEAIKKLEDALNIIASRYTRYELPLRTNEHFYYIIDEDGNYKGNGAINNHDFFNFQNSLELTNDEFNNNIYHKTIFKDNILNVDKKILESMHWKRKAIESNENNEKILWHWISLENLFEIKESTEKTPHIIFDVVSKLLTKKYMYEFAWKHYHKLNNINDTYFSPYKIKITLETSLKKEIGFDVKKGEIIYLKNLINNIDKIRTYLEKDSLFNEQLIYLKEVFSDNKKCLDLLDTFEQIVFEKLVYIYRVRNKIVHNAHVESIPNYYVDFITTISAVSINSFIEKRSTDFLETNQEIINSIIYEYERFKFELKQKGTDILLN